MFGAFKLNLFLFTCSLLTLEWAAQVGLSGVVEDKYSCPHGWTRYGGKKCLKYVSELQDYERAQATCRSKNQGTLVTVHSHEEQNFVYSYIHSIAASSTPIWLGAKQIDFESILWLDKTENSYTNWAPSEPSHPDEICIAINPRNGLWHDVMCTEANVPACERAPTTQWPFFVAFCSEGWFQFNDEKCVRIISSQALNFYESQELCRSKYNSKLLSIKTDKESEFVHNLIKFRDVKLPVWLGAVQNDFSSFNWIDKSDVTFTNWAEGEPNDPDHACISMVASGGKWSDNDCKEQKLILCQKVPEEGACETGWLQFRQDKCYRFVHIRLAFDDAETLCSNLYGGHLPSIHSQEEQFMIAQFLASVNVKNGSEIWLGGRQMDFHNFNWGDGSPFNYSYWEQGEPSFPAEKCIEMSWRNGRWNDINCRLKRAVLCERQVSSRHHLKPILYNQSPSCLGDANCTATTTTTTTTTHQTTSAGATGAQSTGLATVVLASPGSELAPAGDQLATINSANGTSSASNSTSLAAVATPTLTGDPMLTPDDKPIKVIASIMNREQQQSPPLIEPQQPQVVAALASSMQSNRSSSSSSSSGLTSKSASASEFGAPSADQMPPVASTATNSTAPTQFIHYNLPPPERMFDETSQPPTKLEDREKIAVQEKAAPPATVSAQSLQQQQEQPPSESTMSLLDKLKQVTVSSTAASPTTTTTTTTTSLPEFTKASESNTTALNAPAENVVAGVDQQQQQMHSQSQSVALAEHVIAPAQLVSASETPVHQPQAQTTQEFAQVTQSVGGNHPRERINQASDSGELDSNPSSSALAFTRGVK